MTVLPLRNQLNHPGNAVAMPEQASALIVSRIQPGEQHLGEPELREVFDAHEVQLADQEIGRAHV